MSSMDAIDFSLYINACDISEGQLNIDWNEIFANDDILNYLHVNITLPADRVTHRQVKGNSEGIQNALRSQNNQRAYYQEECKKLQERVALLEQQLKELLEGDPKNAANLRLKCLEERLKTSELIRMEQRNRLDLLTKIKPN